MRAFRDYGFTDLEAFGVQHVYSPPTQNTSFCLELEVHRQLSYELRSAEVFKCEAQVGLPIFQADMLTHL